MKKRSTLVQSTLRRAAAAKGPAVAESGNTTTAIVLPQDLLTLLQDVAHKRRAKVGGRASVSQIIVEAIRKLEPALRAE